MAELNNNCGISEVSLKPNYRGLSAREHGRQARTNPVSPQDSLENVTVPKRLFSAIAKPKQHRANENIAPDVR